MTRPGVSSQRCSEEREEELRQAQVTRDTPSDTKNMRETSETGYNMSIEVIVGRIAR